MTDWESKIVECTLSFDKAEKMGQMHYFLPQWSQIPDWRGKLIAVRDYEASCTLGPPIWNEGYSVWWHLTNVRLIRNRFPIWDNAEM